MTPTAALWLILCSAALASGARLPLDEDPYPAQRSPAGLPVEPVQEEDQRRDLNSLHGYGPTREDGNDEAAVGPSSYPAQQSPGLPVEPVQEDQRRDLNSLYGHGPTREDGEDEAAGDQVRINSHGSSSPATMLGDSRDDTLDGDDMDEHNQNGDYEDDDEEYNDDARYDDDGNDGFEEYSYYDDADYYDDDDDNGDDEDEENIENAVYGYGSEDLPNRITNCTDLGDGSLLCFQNDVEDVEQGGEREPPNGDDTGRMDERARWDFLINDDEAKEDEYTDDEDEDEDDEDSDGITDNENDEETDENSTPFPVPVSDDRLKPDLYFPDSIPTIARAYQVDSESIAREEPNDESGTSIVAENRNQDSKLQNKWFEHDSEGTGRTSPHEIPFEEVYELVMHSNQVSEEDKQHIASLERLRRHVNRLGGLETPHSKSLVHHIVKRQLTGSEACVVFRRRRRRAASEAEVRERGSRSRRGIGNVGKSLEQGSPRVRQLFNQYKAMCDFMSLSVFEK
ncbi:uncharacterized protein LOC126987730 [Eriocheir sinensis]|uniref:uncharacterized protein LOC126987730 n=1 Tax=Eriocheir sinensis TaxID=95602 RepID=UPI0021CAD378|nr:uncharacterized protein LOC126987730 [Eriocheir sinensis]